jgi:hypothetical protein
MVRAAADAILHDRYTTTPHLVDTVLTHAAHARLDVERLQDPEVAGSRKALAFNVKQAMNHINELQDHTQKLDKHLRQFPSDPATYVWERDRLTGMRSTPAQQEQDMQDDDDRAQLLGIRGEFSQKERNALAAEGWALPDGSFAIVTRQDLLNAIEAIGRA